MKSHLLKFYILKALLLIKVISFLKLWNYLDILFSFLLSKILKYSEKMPLPFAVSIEPTTNCNLSCPECFLGAGNLTRNSGSMNLETFSKITAQLPNSITYLNLYFQGEPLLNKDFIEMLKLAKCKNYFVSFSTNAHAITDKVAQKIVEAKPDHIIVSIDGYDQDSYQKYRIKGDFETVLKGVSELVKAKKSAKQFYPLIEVQCLVFSHNENKLKEIEKTAISLGVDLVNFKSAQIQNTETYSVFLPQSPEYLRYKKNTDGKYVLKKPRKAGCFRMWSGFVITWDGNVIPCCFDKNAEYSYGNIIDSSFEEIWNGKKHKAFSKNILKNINSIAICRNCI